MVMMIAYGRFAGCGDSGDGFVRSPGRCQRCSVIMKSASVWKPILTVSIRKANESDEEAPNRQLLSLLMPNSSPSVTLVKLWADIESDFVYSYQWTSTHGFCFPGCSILEEAATGTLFAARRFEVVMRVLMGFDHGLFLRTGYEIGPTFGEPAQSEVEQSLAGVVVVLKAGGAVDEGTCCKGQRSCFMRCSWRFQKLNINSGRAVDDRIFFFHVTFQAALRYPHPRCRPDTTHSYPPPPRRKE